MSGAGTAAGRRDRDAAGAAASRSADAALERYYRLHSRIYDLTRWSFLFGRRSVLDALPRGWSPREILEVGCGTGAVLERLARRFPQARVRGVDLSGEMLAVARRRCAGFGSRVALEQRAYAAPHGEAPQFDLVVASYALSMFNPGVEAAIKSAAADLRPGGRIAIVDFHDSPLPWFRRWMALNHVRLEGHLLPLLRARFEPEVERVSRAYGGGWRYAVFVGRVGG